MNHKHYDLDGVPVVELAPEGALVRTARDAVDIIGAAAEHRAELIVIPAARLDDDFFRLRTGVAGDVIQKFVTYHLKVAIVGDISRHLSESSALRDFVHECNRGRDVWFITHIHELDQRLHNEKCS